MPVRPRHAGAPLKIRGSPGTANHCESFEFVKASTRVPLHRAVGSIN